MGENDDRVRRGQAIYAPWSLALYDTVVHRFSNTFIWKCPTHQLERLYDRNVSDRHVDIGVGTGLFLARAHWPTEKPEITLVDLNPHCLDRAARPIARFAPRRVKANVLAPFPADIGGPFRSAGLCYLLHCLPGTLVEKAVVFDHLMQHLEPDASVFGATLLRSDEDTPAAARRLMAIYNRKGVFENAGDTMEDLEQVLRERFAEVDIRREGSVALFEARVR